MNTIPDSVSFSQLCSFLKAKVFQDDFAQEVALDWEDRLSEILFEFESSGRLHPGENSRPAHGSWIISNLFDAEPESP